MPPHGQGFPGTVFPAKPGICQTQRSLPPSGKSHGRLSIRASLQPRDLMEEPRIVKGAWTAKVITLFPEAFPGTLGLSLTGKALDFGLWRLETIDLRPFGDRQAPQRR